MVLPEAAELSELDARLFLPAAVPALWEDTSISVGRILDYYSGGKVVQVPKQGYEEPVVIPKAGRPVIEAAVNSAVQASQLWLLAGTASLCGEPVPPGLITDNSTLQAPLAPVSPVELLPEKLAAVWNNGTATGQGIAAALSERAGKPLPWLVVKNAIEEGLADADAGASRGQRTVAVDGSGTAALKLTLPGKPPSPPPLLPPPSPPGARSASADLDMGQFQDLVDQLGEFKKAAAGFDLKLHVQIELRGGKPVPQAVVDRINELLARISSSLKVHCTSGIRDSKHEEGLAIGLPAAPFGGAVAAGSVRGRVAVVRQDEWIAVEGELLVQPSGRQVDDAGQSVDAGGQIAVGVENGANRVHRNLHSAH